MSIAQVVTRGYGAFGDIAHVVTRGYDIGPELVVLIPVSTVEARAVSRIVDGIDVTRETLSQGVSRIVEGRR